MTNLIDITKEYRTRAGSKVRFYCNDASGYYPIHGAVYIEFSDPPFWNLCSWTNDGYEHISKHCNDSDLVEYCPYSSFKQNDPVFYQNCNGDFWRKGHFSHVKNGIPYIFKPVASIKSVDES